MHCLLEHKAKRIKIKKQKLFRTYFKLFLNVGQPVDDQRIEKFQQDRRLLPHNDVIIAEMMKIGRANYSSYVNGRYPITNAFLKKFYTAFEEELKELRKISSVKEDEKYQKPDYVDRMKELEKKCDRLIESHQLITMEIYQLEKKLEELLNIKFETLLARLNPQK